MKPEVLLSLLHDLQERHVEMRAQRDAWQEQAEAYLAELEAQGVGQPTEE